MELNETQDKKQKLLQEIAMALPIIKQFISKPIEDMTEMDYEQLKSFRDKFKDISKQISELTQEKNIMKNKIQYVENCKKIAPLVPIEDFSEGLTEEGFEKLKTEYEEFDTFLKLEDINQVSVVYEQLEKTILGYEEKIRKEQEREEKRRQEEQKRIKEEQDKENVHKKIKEIESFLMAPDESSNYSEMTAIHPVEGKYNPYADMYIQPVKWVNGKTKYVSDKILEMHKRGYIGVEFLDKIYDAEEIIAGSYLHNCPHDVRKRYTSRIEYTPYEECDIRKKQACKEAQKLLEEIINSKDEKYDKPGRISLRVDIENHGYEIIEIDCTQRELARAGMLPEDFQWKALSIDLSKSVSSAGVKGKIGSKTIERVKGLFQKLLEKKIGKNNDRL